MAGDSIVDVGCQAPRRRTTAMVPIPTAISNANTTPMGDVFEWLPPRFTSSDAPRGADACSLLPLPVLVAWLDSTSVVASGTVVSPVVSPSDAVADDVSVFDGSTAVAPVSPTLLLALEPVPLPVVPDPDGDAADPLPFVDGLFGGSVGLGDGVVAGLPVVGGTAVVVVACGALARGSQSFPLSVPVGTPGIAGGGGVPGGGEVDAVLFNENDQPSTDPAGGVRFPAPQLL